MKRAAALLLGALLLAAATALAAGPAAGPRFESCVGKAPACAPLRSGSVRGAAALAFAPDGRHLYASAYADDVVDAFALGRGGRLRFDGCIADAGSDATGCATAPEGTLEGPAGLVATSSSLFVAAERGDAVVRLRLRRGGHPTLGTCVARRGEACPTREATLRGPAGLAFGPGARDLYVASLEGASLTQLKTGGAGPRNAGTRLRSAGCLAFAGGGGCARARANSLQGVDAIAVAPDGKAAFAVAYSSAAVTELGRTRDGSLTYRGCAGDPALADCRPLPHGSLTGASGIAIAPDGRDLYVTSQVGTVTRFTIAASGRLAFAGCVADERFGGCATVPGDLLAGATGIAVSPDGRRLYVAAQGASALVELGIDGDGPPRLLGCARPLGRSGCSPSPAEALRGAYALAVTPDGGQLFVGSSFASSLAAFTPGLRDPRGSGPRR